MFKKMLRLSCIVIPLLVGCTENAEQPTSMAPDFTLQDLSGNTVSLSDFKGKVVLIDFFATWCPPCRASVPAIERLHTNYTDKGLVVLAISLDEGKWDYVKSFQSEYGITYTILKGTDDVAMQYMVRTIPTLVIADKKGNVWKRIIGFGNEEWQEQVEVRTPPGDRDRALFADRSADVGARVEDVDVGGAVRAIGL